MSWHLGAIAGFDLEATGPEPATARIVTADLLIRQPATEVIAVDRKWLVHPGIPIPAEATAVHGITDAQAEQGILAPVAVADIIRAIAEVLPQCPLVIYNAAYDLTVLNCEARRYDLKPLDLSQAVIIDPHVIDKAVDRYRKGSRKLDATCEHYGLVLDGAHDSGNDALASMRLAWKIAQAYPRLAEMPGRDLMAYQARARRGQAASLAAYFRRTGQTQDVNGEWPIQRQPEGARP